MTAVTVVTVDQRNRTTYKMKVTDSRVVAQQADRAVCGQKMPDRHGILPTGKRVLIPHGSVVKYPGKMQAYRLIEPGNVRKLAGISRYSIDMDFAYRQTEGTYATWFSDNYPGNCTRENTCINKAEWKSNPNYPIKN